MADLEHADQQRIIMGFVQAGKQYGINVIAEIVDKNRRQITASLTASLTVRSPEKLLPKLRVTAYSLPKTVQFEPNHSTYPPIIADHCCPN